MSQLSQQTCSMAVVLDGMAPIKYFHFLFSWATVEVYRFEIAMREELSRINTLFLYL